MEGGRRGGIKGTLCEHFQHVLNECTTTETTTLTPATCHAVETDDVQADADAPCGYIAQLRMPLIMMMTGVT